ncbi:hypothetical protein [Hoeflea sp. AS16]|uniref:hypothetical protein n=1 Tax=Hoeflea sp. AS16 TaxID=3135779 RepID=UPI0031814E10
MKPDTERFLQALSKIEGTQEAKAVILGVSSSAISQWSSGVARPGSARCFRLAEVLDWPAAILFESGDLDEFERKLADTPTVDARLARSRLQGVTLTVDGRFEATMQRRLKKFVGNFWLFRRSIQDPDAYVAKSALCIFEHEKSFKFLEVRRIFATQETEINLMRMEGSVAITSQSELVFSGHTFAGMHKKPKYMISNEYVEDVDSFSVLLTAPSLKNEPAFACSCLLMRSASKFEAMTEYAKIIEVQQAQIELEKYQKKLPPSDAFVVLGS